MDKFRWCFIGAGRLAKHVAAELNQSGRHEIVSVYTRNFDVGKEFAEEYGGKAYSSLAEALDDKRVDGVYIVTPHNSHYEYAKAALEKGVPVLCEKSLTVNACETDDLIRIAGERKVYLAEAMWTWFGEAANQAKKWIEDGKLGKIDKAELSYHVMIKGTNPRLTDPKRAGGALLDIGVYPVTYLYRLFGYPEEIRCLGRLEAGVDVAEEIELTFKNGLTATASVSMEDTEKGEMLYIRGEKGELKQEAFHMNGEIQLKRTNGEDELFQGRMGYVNEFDLVAEEIRRGCTESPMVPLQATSDVMHIMDECRRQMGLTYVF